MFARRTRTASHDHPEPRSPPWDDVEAHDALSPRRRRRRPRRCALCCVLLVVAAFIFTAITLATDVVEEDDAVISSTGAAPLAKVDYQIIGATLATQASQDRVWLLRFLCARWSGPISVAVVADTDVSADAVCGSSQGHPSSIQLRSMVSTDLAWRGASLLGGRTTMQRFAPTKDYPINALRNAALNAVTTSHVLVVDVDFFPSSELHEAILAQSLYLRHRVKAALVVPAFQHKGNFRSYSDKRWKSELAKPDFIPETFSQLLDCLASVACIVFDFTWNRDAHSSTDTAAWVDATARAAATRARYASDRVREAANAAPGKDAPKLVEGSQSFAAGITPTPIKCFKSARFEPYVVLRNNADVRFDASYTGYGKNKIEQIARLRYSGYEFAVLPLGFLVHAPHPWSSAKRSWMKAGRGSHDTDRLYKQTVQAARDRVDARDGVNRTWLCGASYVM